MDKFFDRKYAVELPKLKYGANEEEFLLDRSFFEGFEYSMVREGEVKVKAVIVRYERHLDAKFNFEGFIFLECDRCSEPYPHTFKSERRVIFSYDPALKFDTDEVVLISESDHILDLSREFYEFVHLEIPLRRVPAREIHLCSPRVLEILGLSPEGEELENIPPTEEPGEDEDEIDPRWQALKKFKDKN